MEMENTLKERLEDLQKQLVKKQSFEAAVSSLGLMMHHHYAAASLALQQMMYAAVCRAATLLQTRYVAPGYWITGLKLFEETEHLVSKASEKNHMKACITRAVEYLGEQDERSEGSAQPQQNPNSRFLFDGQLTVGPEPPLPAWLAAQNLLTALAVSSVENDTAAESSHTTQDNNVTGGSAGGSTSNIVEQVISNLQEINYLNDNLANVIEAALQEAGSGPRGAPPASKEIVAKLPIIDVTEEVLVQIGKGTECAVCREHWVVGDKMQEMPCKHLFHPNCLKPWLDEHNSCPICRYELQTDDHDYESRKEREKEAEEERKGAENAIRGGEYMYV